MVNSNLLVFIFVLKGDPNIFVFVLDKKINRNLFILVFAQKYQTEFVFSPKKYQTEFVFSLIIGVQFFQIELKPVRKFSADAILKRFQDNILYAGREPTLNMGQFRV